LQHLIKIILNLVLDKKKKGGGELRDLFKIEFIVVFVYHFEVALNLAKK
jgi:hypothetical protein